MRVKTLMNRITAAFLSVVVTMGIPLCSTPVGAEDYPNTHVNTGNQIEDLIAVAETQVGFQGTNNIRNKYTLWCGYIPDYPDGGYGYEWCQAFVGWCANQAGISANIIPREPGTWTCKSFFVNNGLWYDSSYHGGTYTPKRGDIVYFQWDGAQGEPSHVGIVAAVTDTMIYTIEGNTGYDQVLEHSYPINDYRI